MSNRKMVELCESIIEKELQESALNLIFDLLDKGMKNGDLAALLGISTRTLRRWKDGVTPKASSYYMLCELVAKMSESA